MARNYIRSTRWRFEERQLVDAPEPEVRLTCLTQAQRRGAVRREIEIDRRAPFVDDERRDQSRQDGSVEEDARRAGFIDRFDHEMTRIVAQPARRGVEADARDVGRMCEPECQ